MTIPIENAVIYVEPIYIQASSGENNLPEMKKVIVSYQNEIVMADSLEQGLEQIFDYDSGEDTTESSQKDNGSAPSQSGSSTSAAELASKASQLFTEAQNAQKSGDWAGYGNKLKELEGVLNELKKATGVQ